jgi:ribosomal-protein-alanine N-acetyltransferase
MSELPPLRIRRSGAQDAGALLEIDQICFSADIAFSHGEIASHLNHPKSIAWAAERAGRILGYLIAHRPTELVTHVITLDVLPEARRQGIGTALMRRMHKESKQLGVHVIVLEVGIANRPAQTLYEKLRYRYIDKLSGYYHGREDAYRMARFFE